MDPLSALSLTSNILQLIEISYKGISLCYEIYENGTEIKYSSLRETCGFLTTACDELQATRSVASQALHTASIDPLFDVSLQCHSTAQKLVKKIDAIAVPKKSNVFAVVGKALKSVQEAREVQKLKDQLHAYEAVLDTQILVRLSKQLRSLDHSQAEARKEMGKQVNAVGDLIVAGETTVLRLLTHQHLQTKTQLEQLRYDQQVIYDHVDDLARFLQNATISDDENSRFEKILSSLYFAEMYYRQSAIDEAHVHTCEWILHDKNRLTATGLSFSDWLVRGDEKIYWIEGKAGSGKSTLMNYLVDEAGDDRSTFRTIMIQNMVVLSFFLWKAGTDLQRNTQGLLRSLLHQLLRASASVSHLRMTDLLAVPELQASVWNKKMLIRALTAVSEYLHSPILVLVDGLDEVYDEQSTVETVELVSTVPFFKVCVSSRWSSEFECAFSKCPRLRMQDLTKHDIERYVKDKLIDDPRVTRIAQRNKIEADQLAEEIRSKAEGVFLWVKLAIKDVLRGVRNLDDLEKLRRRIERLPTDIYDLYIDMWSRFKPDHDLYSEEAALYFGLTSHAEMDLWMFATAVNADKAELAVENADMEQLVSVLLEFDVETWIARVQTSCAGLIEIRRGDPSRPRYHEVSFYRDLTPGLVRDHSQGSLQPVLATYADYRVEFVHRTAKDFLHCTTVGKAIMAPNTSLARDIPLITYKALWVDWLIRHAIGENKHAPLLSSVIYDTHDSKSVETMKDFALRVSDVAQHFLHQGYLQTHYNWMDSLIRDPSGIRAFRLPSDGKRGINFVRYMIQEGETSFAEWRQGRDHNSLTKEDYSQLLWQQAISRNPDPRKVNWLLQQGADANYRPRGPYGPFSGSVIVALLHSMARHRSHRVSALRAERCHSIIKAVLDAGGDARGMSMPSLQVFFPRYHDDDFLVVDPYVVSQRTIIDIVQGLENDWGATFGKIGTLLRSRSSSALGTPLLFCKDGKIWPVPTDNVDQFRRLCVRYGFFDMATESILLKSAAIVDEMESILHGTAPFASPQATMRHFGRSEQEIETATTEYERGAEVFQRYTSNLQGSRHLSMDYVRETIRQDDSLTESERQEADLLFLYWHSHIEEPWPTDCSS